MEKNEIERIVNSAKLHVEMAASEIAYSFETVDDMSFNFPDLYERLSNAKVKPRDWKGWLGNELFNSRNFCGDLAGDKIDDLVYTAMVAGPNAKRNARDQKNFKEALAANITKVKVAFEDAFHIKNLF